MGNQFCKCLHSLNCLLVQNYKNMNTYLQFNRRIKNWLEYSSVSIWNIISQPKVAYFLNRQRFEDSTQMLLFQVRDQMAVSGVAVLVGCYWELYLEAAETLLLRLRLELLYTWLFRRLNSFAWLLITLNRLFCFESYASNLSRFILAAAAIAVSLLSYRPILFAICSTFKRIKPVF